MLCCKRLKENKPIAKTQFCDTKNTEISNDDLSIIQENIFALQIFMHDALGM